MDSYVFYNSFHEAIKDLNDAEYGAIMRIINEYALNGEVPEITNPLIKVVFTLIKPQIDANIKRRSDGNKGGRPSKTNETEENNHRLENEKPMVIEKKTIGFESENHRLENEKPNVNENVNVNVNVNVNENENVCASAPETLSPSLYSDSIFDIFSDAGLPCAGGNKLSFLQKDFKNAICYLHKTPELAHLHSSDVIGACRNYVAVLKDSVSYIKNKYTFERFVKLKNFSDFLPDNFVIQNFRKWDLPPEEAEKEKPKEKRFHWLHCSCGANYSVFETVCPECGSDEKTFQNGLTYPENYKGETA